MLIKQGDIFWKIGLRCLHRNSTWVVILGSAGGQYPSGFILHTMSAADMILSGGPSGHRNYHPATCERVDTKNSRASKGGQTKNVAGLASSQTRGAYLHDVRGPMVPTHRFTCYRTRIGRRLVADYPPYQSGLLQGSFLLLPPNLAGAKAPA